MSGITITTPASSEPLTSAETRAFLRLEDNVETSLVTSLITTARIMVENLTGLVMINTVVKQSLDGVGEYDVPIYEGTRVAPFLTQYKNFIELEKNPVSNVGSVHFYDDSDNQSTWATSNYYVDTVRRPAKIYLRDGGSFPTDLRRANGLEVNYTCGFGANATDVPEALRVAMLQLVAHLFEHRGESEDRAVAIPVMVDKLIQPFKILRYGDGAYMTGYRSGIM